MLFLRSFGPEASQRPVTRGDLAQRRLFLDMSVLDPSGFETRLAAALRPSRFAIVGIENPLDLAQHWSNDEVAIAKLALPNDGWESEVESLIDRAAWIVVYCAGKSRGISEELQRIALQRQQEKAVVVLADEVDPALAGMSEEVLDALGADRLRPASFGVDDALDAGFRRVVHENSIYFDDLSVAEHFSDLVGATGE